mmetsp:Transcript_113418/g.225786  ORF Transcript_113418/g.225786 Transcript_113418/m.225786 type:complete len:128 (+) Transcript_113418:48-431(+)
MALDRDYNGHCMLPPFESTFLQDCQRVESRIRQVLTAFDTQTGACLDRKSNLIRAEQPAVQTMWSPFTFSDTPPSPQRPASRGLLDTNTQGHGADQSNHPCTTDAVEQCSSWKPRSPLQRWSTTAKK